jgi:hypothetical protein
VPRLWNGLPDRRCGRGGAGTPARPEFRAPTEGIALTRVIVSRDVARPRRFYTEVLGGEAILEGEFSIVALANGWVTISVGGGPTDDNRPSRSSRRRISIA